MLQSLIEPYVFGTVSVKNNNELPYVVLISEAYSCVIYFTAVVETHGGGTDRTGYAHPRVFQ